MKYTSKEIVRKLKAIDQYDNYLDYSQAVYQACHPASEAKPMLNRLLSRLLEENIELDWRVLNAL